MTMTTRILLVALALSLALPAGARSKKKEAEPQSTTALLNSARAKMADLDFDKAEPLLQKALRDTSLQGSVRTQALVDLGICQANLNKDGEARASFAEAFRLDDKAALPPHTSPKIVSLFESQRPKPVEKPPEPEKKPELAQTSPPPTVPAPAPAPAVTRTAPEERSMALPAVCAGVGAAGLATGIYFGLRSSGAANDLSKGVSNRQTADDLLARQHSSATLSAVGYGVALAGAAAAAGFYFLGGDSGSETSAALVPLPGGVAVSFAGTLRLPGAAEVREGR